MQEQKLLGMFEHDVLDTIKNPRKNSVFFKKADFAKKRKIDNQENQSFKSIESISVEI